MVELDYNVLKQVSDGVFGLAMLVGGVLLVRYLAHKNGRTRPLLESIIAIFYLFVQGVFLLVLEPMSPYHVVINPAFSSYSPIAADSSTSLVVYFVLFVLSCIALWIRGLRMPPLLAVVCIALVQIGLCLAVIFTIQVLGQTEQDHHHEIESFVLVVASLFSVLLGVLLLAKVVVEQRKRLHKRVYKHTWLAKAHGIVDKHAAYPVWALIFSLPLLLLLTVVLLLFGQEPDSLVTSFTDTSTWFFSQQEHPPYSHYDGHYLCTVAACGSPAIVKPVRLGKRGGQTIIVNRQLMVANAFEDLIMRMWPWGHKLVRNLYDRYGFPLSRYIYTPFRSNLTYLFMKPFEWFFVCCLYLFSATPEKLIQKQYQV